VFFGLYEVNIDLGVPPLRGVGSTPSGASRRRPSGLGLPIADCGFRIADLKTLVGSIKGAFFNLHSAICNHQLKSPGGIPLSRDHFSGRP